jgi:hypothetical protein
VVYQYGLNHNLRWFFYFTPDIRRVKSVSSEAALRAKVRAARRCNRKLRGCYWTWAEPEPTVTVLGRPRFHSQSSE